MKKRSNPIPLLSVAVILFVVIGYFNLKSQPAAPDQKPEAQQPQQPAGAPPAMSGPRAAPSKDELKSKVDVGGTSKPGGPPTGMPAPPQMGGPPGMPGKFPKIPKAGTKPPKPMPSDSQISTQWYTDETNKTAGH